MGVFETISELAVGKMIVDAPTDVLLTHSRAIAPPGVMARTLLKMSEGIDITLGDELIEPGALGR
jgi:hypothetical protein